jgi:nucleotide-binding universal stress UspA family protein
MEAAWIVRFGAWSSSGSKVLLPVRRLAGSGCPSRAALAEGAGKQVPGIVVGVDGSAVSQQALEWAVTHAALEHAPLTVLAVHRVAASAWTGNPVIYPGDRPEARRVVRAAEEAVAEAVSKLGDDRPSSVTVRGFLGQTGHALTEASRDADLVVVGARGGFARLLPGSVRAEVVNHAACPVVVVSGQR